MAIWFNTHIALEQLQQLGKNTLGEHLGIVFTGIGNDYLQASMPVDHRTRQPYGILHGGASVALAETLGSIASAMVIDPAVSICVGLEINANHVRSVQSGMVIATCRPLHLGGQTHVWDIRIENEQQQLVCISRLTVAILHKRN
jgi:1,4-dihydroxy-2-naphthoyl-CoA hydrolase